LLTIEHQLAVLVGQDESAAEAAAVELAAHGEGAVPGLLQLLDSQQPDHRWWALRSLAAMDNPQTDWFLRGLRDSREENRAAAALALAIHPDPRAIGLLIGLLSDGDNVTAVMAVNALAKIGNEAVVPLINAYDGAPRRAQIQILRCLAELRDHRSIPLLLKAQGESSAVAQYWAQEGLERLGLNMVYLTPDQS
jgi:HEAT repeat protein